MLDIRPTCEYFNTDLPFDSNEAMICTFECTFCKDCIQNLLKKYPVSTKIFHKPVDIEKHKERLKNR